MILNFVILHANQLLVGKGLAGLVSLVGHHGVVEFRGNALVTRTEHPVNVFGLLLALALLNLIHV